jgi:hypothetical protein
VSAPGKLPRSSRWKTGTSKGRRPLMNAGDEVAKRTQRLHGVWDWLRRGAMGRPSSTEPSGARSLSTPAFEASRRSFRAIISSQR